MPGPLIAFWILTALGAVSALSDPQAPIWGGIDPKSHSGGSYKPPQEFYATADKPWGAYSKENIYGKRECEVTIFAFAPRPTRITIDRVEQNIDTVWTHSGTIPENMAARVPIVWIDPITRKVLQEQTFTIPCWKGQRENYGELYDERGILR